MGSAIAALLGLHNPDPTGVLHHIQLGHAEPMVRLIAIGFSR